jgi:hypothetical protein
VKQQCTTAVSYYTLYDDISVLGLPFIQFLAFPVQLTDRQVFEEVWSIWVKVI